MSKRFVFLTMLVFCVLTSGLIWHGATSSLRSSSQAAQVEANQDATPLNRINEDNVLPSLIRINEKARAARGGQESSIHELADGIFNTFGVSTGRDGGANLFEKRLIRAQINYQNGVSKGISEINVVRTINGLGKKFGAPDYAKTDLGEVRKLRMGMLSYLPHLIYGESKRPKKEVGSSIDPMMSPLEAVYVTMLMLKQKQYNEEYQRTPKERAAALHKKHKGAQGTTIAKQPERQLILDQATPRKQEIAHVIAHGFSNKSPNELMDLTNKSLDVLGIDR